MDLDEAMIKTVGAALRGDSYQQAVEAARPPDARGICYAATCAQCGTTAEQTFEGFHVAGWTCVPRPQQGLSSQWFCPACVHGLTRAE